jgi:hypothetical protein
MAAYRQSPLARGIRHGVLGKTMAPVLPPFLRRVWFAPGEESAGWYGSIMGAYLVSAHMHLVMVWGLGRGPELLHTAGFFVMLGVGTIFEKKWKEWTGKRVMGVFGSLWTTFWHLMWGSGMVDAFVRRGIVANDFVPEKMRIGKAMVDVVLAVVASVRG